jgi:hypothetical protein
MFTMGNWRGWALVIAAIALICTSVYAEQSSISGTLSAKLDEKAGTVTAMFVGYCQGDPVMIGPMTWKSSAQEFTRESLNEIGDKLCGSNNSIKKVTRTVNTGKEIVAEIVVSSESPAILVGR